MPSATGNNFSPAALHLQEMMKKKKKRTLDRGVRGEGQRKKERKKGKRKERQKKKDRQSNIGRT